MCDYLVFDRVRARQVTCGTDVSFMCVGIRSCVLWGMRSPVGGLRFGWPSFLILMSYLQQLDLLQCGCGSLPTSAVSSPVATAALLGPGTLGRGELRHCRVI